jgi:hypothetical protein
MYLRALSLFGGLSLALIGVPLIQHTPTCHFKVGCKNARQHRHKSFALLFL